jgi:hypothetical protein
MKLFFLVSSLDLTQPFSATPAWWQLMKGLYEIGVEVIAAPYQGPSVETPWWRAEANAAKWQGDLFKGMRDVGRKVAKPSPPAPLPQGAGRQEPLITEQDATNNDEPNSQLQDLFIDRMTRRTAQTLIAPLWEKHLDRILTREPDIDAIIILTAPLNHLVGVAGEIQRKHNKPVFYYDGDVPASLPTMHGFASGFRIYQGADLSEYAAFISNSKGGAEQIKALGARAVHTLYYGADPMIFSPVEVEQDIDVFFYGHGREYRDSWIDAMITQPSQMLQDAAFAVRGTKLDDLGRTQFLPYLSFSKLREYACRSKLNLCITRAAHASVYASSSSRPFELAGMGCCMVANPYLGVEEWFEPNKEIFILNSADEAADRYRYLLTHEVERKAAGEAARVRLLKQHTFIHRARELAAIVRSYL